MINQIWPLVFDRKWLKNSKIVQQEPNMWSLDKLKAKLDALHSVEYNSDDIQSKSLTQAAILIPIVIKNDTPFVLLTVRAMHLSHWPGQISFPGGKRDEGDVDIVATALRETQEEIGMSSENLKILGQLSTYVTKETHLHVTPVVAEVLNYENFTPKINPVEVSEIFMVPLEIFILNKYHKCRHFSYDTEEGKKQLALLDYFEFEEDSNCVHIIWGLTALIATDVASLLFERKPEFEYHEWLTKVELIHKSKL